MTDISDDKFEPALCGCAVRRRAVLMGLGATAVGLAAGPALAQDDPATMAPQPGDLIVRASGDDRTTPLTPADLEAGGAPIQAWPFDPAAGVAREGTLFNLLLLSRWDPAQLTADAQANAAEGVLAHTIICTHAACEVTDFIADAQVMECPCHQSQFSLRSNGAVVQGPATRKLPSLPLAVQDGKLVVAGAFDGRVGGDAE